MLEPLGGRCDGKPRQERRPPPLKKWNRGCDVAIHNDGAALPEARSVRARERTEIDGALVARAVGADEARQSRHVPSRTGRGRAIVSTSRKRSSGHVAVHSRHTLQNWPKRAPCTIAPRLGSAVNSMMPSGHSATHSEQPLQRPSASANSTRTPGLPYPAVRWWRAERKAA